MIDMTLQLLADHWFLLLLFGGSVSSMVGAALKNCNDSWRELVCRSKQVRCKHDAISARLKAKEDVLDKLINEQKTKETRFNIAEWEKISRAPGFDLIEFLDECEHAELIIDVTTMGDSVTFQQDSYDAVTVTSGTYIQAGNTDKLYHGRSVVDPENVLKTTQLKKGNVGFKTLKEW